MPSLFVVVVCLCLFFNIAFVITKSRREKKFFKYLLVATEEIRYLGINLTKDGKDLCGKTFKKIY